MCDRQPASGSEITVLRAAARRCRLAYYPVTLSGRWLSVWCGQVPNFLPPVVWAGHSGAAVSLPRVHRGTAVVAAAGVAAAGIRVEGMILGSPRLMWVGIVTQPHGRIVERCARSGILRLITLQIVPAHASHRRHMVSYPRTC